MAERRRPPVPDDSPETLGQVGGPTSTPGDPKPARGQGFSKTALISIATVGLIFFLSLSLIYIIVDHQKQDGGAVKDPRGNNVNNNNEGSPPKGVNYRTGASKTLRGDTQQEMELPVLLTFTNVKENPNLRAKLELCVTSMFSYTSTDLSLLIIGDNYSQEVAASIIRNAAEKVENKVNYKLVALDVDGLTMRLHNIVHSMQKFFSYKPGAYYSQALFFLSLAIHRVMPPKLRKVIMLDADLRFDADIAELFGHFDRFADTNVIGIAREMQPVYRHIFHMYRHENPGTRIGSPPPDGLTGFNSGVLLLNIDRMRKSVLYNSFLDPDVVHNLTVKYKFRGHLGDQDFFTLLSLDYEDLFYVLPCNWNRQLCQWWRDKGYDDVFDEYFSCEGKVKIFHGNCNTPIPP